MSKPDFAPAVQAGIDHFNALEFWEELWLVAESDLDQFLQGLIQVAAAYHHLKRGTFPGGVRLFDSGLARLARFPGGACGIDRGDVERVAQEHRAWAAERIASGETEQRLAPDAYPKLHVLGKIAPTIEPW
jgi:Domain of unknown function (DUF309)